MKYNPDTDKVDHSIQIDKLYDRIRELSMPCKKIFGWVPDKILLLSIVAIPILILAVIAAATLGIQFTLVMFGAFDWNMGPYDPDHGLFAICFFCVFFYLDGCCLKVLQQSMRKRDGKLMHTTNNRF
jgi:hypothetical protein